MRQLVGILVCLLGCFFATSSAKVNVFTLDSLLNAKVSLFPGQSVSVKDESESSVKDAVKNAKEIIEQPAALKYAYSIYQTEFKKPESGSIKVFSSTSLEIIENNINARLGKKSYESAVNQFTDLTVEEATASYTGALVEPSNSTSEVPFDETETEWSTTAESTRVRRKTYPASKSWVDLGYVSPVKNQNQCGSCAIFAVTAAVESAHAICNDRTIVDLSEQQVLDCTDGPGIFHCEGNMVDKVLKYVTENGQTSEDSYSYTHRQGTCRSKVASTAYPTSAKLTSWWQVEWDEEKIKEALADFGPVVAVINVASGIFSYSRGIFSGSCESAPHAVLIVGYGTENGLDYWLIKNSWATSWGENGYLRIKRGVNQCKVKDWVYAVQACSTGFLTSTTYSPIYTSTNSYKPYTSTSSYNPYYTTSVYNPRTSTFNYKPNTATSSYNPYYTTSVYNPRTSTSSYYPYTSTTTYYPRQPTTITANNYRTTTGSWYAYWQPTTNTAYNNPRQTTSSYDPRFTSTSYNIRQPTTTTYYNVRQPTTGGARQPTVTTSSPR